MKIREYLGRAATQETDHIPATGVVLLVLLCLLWGGNMVSIKISNQGVPPILAATVRSILSATVLWMYALLMGRSVFLKGADVKHGVAIGAIFGLEFLVLYYGTALTNVSRAIIFLYTQPLWTALGAHFFLSSERLTLSKSLGLFLSFFGLVTVFGSRPTNLGEYYWVGDLMEVAAAILWAATNIYIKRFMLGKPITHYQTLFAQLFFSIPVLVAGWLIFEWSQPLSFQTIVIVSLVYQGFIIAFASYLLWFWMIHRYQVSRLAAFTFLTPLSGVILSAVLLKEQLTVFVLVGLALVAAGLYLVNRPDTPKRA
ncbi:MAG TPA: DMT family transporter [Desulfomonilaceae bacterium]|nr:DMT family transporter [Desulfomonilaceae bacterium]